MLDLLIEGRPDVFGVFTSDDARSRIFHLPGGLPPNWSFIRSNTRRTSLTERRT
jgi:hypothetical protein